MIHIKQRDRYETRVASKWNSTLWPRCPPVSFLFSSCNVSVYEIQKHFLLESLSLITSMFQKSVYQASHLHLKRPKLDVPPYPRVSPPHPPAHTSSRSNTIIVIAASSINTSLACANTILLHGSDGALLAAIQRAFHIGLVCWQASCGQSRSDLSVVFP